MSELLDDKDEFEKPQPDLYDWMAEEQFRSACEMEELARQVRNEIAVFAIITLSWVAIMGLVFVKIFG